MQALLLLGTLPDSWETLLVTISNLASNGVLALSTIKDNSFNEEIRRRDMEIDNTQAFVIENKGRSKSKELSGWSKSKERSYSKWRIKCYYHTKEGHMKRNYKVLKKEWKEEKNKKE